MPKQQENIDIKISGKTQYCIVSVNSSGISK